MIESHVDENRAGDEHTDERCDARAGWRALARAVPDAVAVGGILQEDVTDSVGNCQKCDSNNDLLQGTLLRWLPLYITTKLLICQ